MNSRLPDTFLITSVDPGRTTGLSLLQVTPITVTVVTQCAEEYIPELGTTPVNTIMGWAERYYGTPHVFLYEPFHVRPGKKSVDPVGLEIIGAVKDRLLTHNLRPYASIVAQEPVHAKRASRPLVTDAVLNRLGLFAYGKNANHINDTFRHAATYLAERAHRWTCETGWPREQQSAAPILPKQDPEPPNFNIPTQR